MEQTEERLIVKIPRPLKKGFHSKCAASGITMTKAVEFFIERVVKGDIKLNEKERVAA